MSGPEQVPFIPPRVATPARAARRRCLRMVGRVEGAVGVESLIAQTVQRSGEKPTVAPHLGLEGEVWPQWVKLRAGSYKPANVENVII